MLGTTVNAIAIIVGCAAGLLIKSGLSGRYKEIILQAVGLSVLFIGIASSLGNLLQPEAHPILFIISLVIGGALGEFIGIEQRLKSMGDFFERRLAGDEGSFSKGFVSASILFCVGSMAILGSFQSGTQGEHSILFAKSVLDGVISIIFASTWGLGVMLSAVSVFIYQGTLTMGAQVAEPYLTADMLREISIVGGVLMSAIGIDMLNMCKIKVGNLLPAVVVPVVYYAAILPLLINLMGCLLLD